MEPTLAIIPGAMCREPAVHGFIMLSVVLSQPFIRRMILPNAGDQPPSRIGREEIIIQNTNDGQKVMHVGETFRIYFNSAIMFEHSCEPESNISRKDILWNLYGRFTDKPLVNNVKKVGRKKSAIE